MQTSPLVLVVDDDPTNREVLVEALSEDHIVITAERGPEALRLAAQHTPDIVIVDVVLPEMNGYELCQRLRATKGMEGAVIIIASARAMAGDRERGLAAGAHAYLTKPFSYNEVIEMIRTTTAHATSSSTPT